MIDLTKYKLTDKGLEIPITAEAIKKDRELYPTYDALVKRHNEHFKVIEKLRLLKNVSQNPSVGKRHRFKVYTRNIRT